MSDQLTCEFCEIQHPDVTVDRQRTSYPNVIDNLVVVCPTCKQINDEYWDDMWAGYYSGLL